MFNTLSCYFLVCEIGYPKHSNHTPLPPQHIREKDRFQRFLPSATFFWKVPRRGAEKRVLSHLGGFPGNSVVKNLPANAGAMGSIPGSGRSPEEGNGDPLQYFCLGNPSVPAVFLPRRLAGYTESQRVRHDLVTKQKNPWLSLSHLGDPNI